MANPITPATEVTAIEAPLYVPSDLVPDYSEILAAYESPAESIYSEKHQRLLTEPLHSSWSGPGAGRTFIACSNVGIYYGLRLPPIVPDAFLSIDVRLPPDPFLKQHRAYFRWEYAKSIDVVIETVSNKDGGELDRKMEIYARAGAAYYVVWDPDHLLGADKLHVFVSSGGKYEPLAKAWFPSVNLGLTPWQGVYEDMDAEWLRWCDEHGEVIPTGAERAAKEHEFGQQQQERAELEQKRAEQAQRRAEQENLRVEQLEAILRAHGIEPPSRST